MKVKPSPIVKPSQPVEKASKPWDESLTMEKTF